MSDTLYLFLKQQLLIWCVPRPWTVLYKNTNHQQMHKESFIINCNTVLHVSTLLGHLQGELLVIVTLRLHFIVEWECAVDCVLCTGGVNSLQSGPCRPGPDRREIKRPNTTHYTDNSTFSLNYKVQPLCNDNKKFSLKVTQQGRNMCYNRW
jgi:hypothetical protein